MIVEKILGCSRGEFPIKYLGVPVRRTKLKEDWTRIIKHIQKKLEGWQARFLPLGERITLINSALSAMPLYQALVYKIPTWVLKTIDKLRRKFLWAGAKGERRACSLIAWNQICRSKEQGGLGISQIKYMNMALLARW